jgi:hypothetical protein
MDRMVGVLRMLRVLGMVGVVAFGHLVLGVIAGCL